MTRAIRVALTVMQLLVSSAAYAQTAGQTQEPAAEHATGLPAHVDWTFNFDAGWGTFGFGNSYFNNPKGSEPENLSDQWFEGFIKPTLSASYTLQSSSVLYGKVSAVGERTYGSPPELYGPDISSFGPEDASIGWRSGTSMGAGEDAIDVSVGRVKYQLGHGMLLWDGASEGGSRGGYWTNARKAFEFGTVARGKTGRHTIEGFYLDKDELDESDSGTRLWGTNYQVGLARNSTIGATYLRFFANDDLTPQRDGLNVYNLRVDSAPVLKAPGFDFQFEYAAERNGDRLDSNAWTVLGGYEFGGRRWTPKVTYRYAFFQGDDPATGKNEAFDPLLPGFSDWGSWWQGEIAGEYFLSNSNLISQQIRAHLTPNDHVGGGVIFYDFSLDHPESVSPTVTDTHAAFETDFYVDWNVNATVTVSFAGAFANPGDAVKQLSGRTKSYAYGMVYVAYSY